MCPEVRLEERVEELDARTADDHADREFANHRQDVGDQRLAVDVVRLGVPRRQPFIEHEDVRQAATLLLTTFVEEELMHEEREGEIACFVGHRDRQVDRTSPPSS